MQRDLNKGYIMAFKLCNLVEIQRRYRALKLAIFYLHSTARKCCIITCFCISNDK